MRMILERELKFTAGRRINEGKMKKSHTYREKITAKREFTAVNRVCGRVPHMLGFLV